MVEHPAKQNSSLVVFLNDSGLYHCLHWKPMMTLDVPGIAVFKQSPLVKYTMVLNDMKTTSTITTSSNSRHK
jgi:hypothetical protein